MLCCRLSDSIAFSLFLGILLSFLQFETADGFIFSFSATNPVPPSKEMSCEILFIKSITKKIKHYIKIIEFKMNFFIFLLKFSQFEQ